MNNILNALFFHACPTAPIVPELKIPVDEAISELPLILWQENWKNGTLLLLWYCWAQGKPYAEQ